MDAYQVAAFLAASVMLTLLPGPDILYVITQSIASGWRSGVAVALGLCSGLIIHTSAIALGVAAILVKYPITLMGIKIVGAGYLLFLAYKSFGERNINFSNEHSPNSYRGLIKIGFIMNVVNPKVLLFFLAFLPQFIVKGPSPTIQIFTLGSIFFIQALIVFSLIALFAGLLNKKLMHSQANRYIGKIKSGVYILIAANLFWI